MHHAPDASPLHRRRRLLAAEHGPEFPATAGAPLRVALAYPNT
jgi:hypothetical protein